MRSRGSDLFMLLSVVCTVFILFALVASKAERGKAAARTAPTRHVTHNKRHKATLPGQASIAGFFAGGSSTHAIPVGAPLPVDGPIRNKLTAPQFLAKYVDIHEWLRFGVHPLNESSTSNVEEGTTFEKVLYCAHSVEKGRAVHTKMFIRLHQNIGDTSAYCIAYSGFSSICGFLTYTREPVLEKYRTIP